jgi:hypothetical protein
VGIGFDLVKRRMLFLAGDFFCGAIGFDLVNSNS